MPAYRLRSSRFRVIVFMWRKGAVEQVHDVRKVYDNVTAKIREYVSTNPSDYLIPRYNSELLREAEQLAFTRGRRFRPWLEA